MAITKPYTYITDIGSTTTKGILIDNAKAKLLAIAHADTTVEEPDNNVAIGVFKAAEALQKESGIRIMDEDATALKLSFHPDIAYLSTSSAGGGLQILVIGLTLFDSASSAKRAAYGAGGVILDVFAIDDKRRTVEQMQIMRNLRPDLILLCGGTDGGALSSVLRMAEILRIAKPLPKYSSKAQIPTIYAGNKDAAEMIKDMITKDFDLHILPNLRPKLNMEVLQPTQDKIQELFMENVMEHAPGYTQVKSVVDGVILPTPSGLLTAMQSFGKDERNLIAFDIGGATTDVFTRINGHFQRTVSANLGMSYSALNVLKESGITSIAAMLPQTISEDTIRNYLGNKSLYPTVDPLSSKEFRIEHALAKAALSMAAEQHKQMHYNTSKLGYLDAIRNEGKDRFEEKFNYVKDEQNYSFYASDLDILIGAGGVFAHAQSLTQCMDILISGFKPVGITELMIDKHFISPHLGVLSTMDKHLAKSLLDSECLESLAMYIRPSFTPKKGLQVLAINSDDKHDEIILSDSFLYLPAQKGRRLNLTPLKKSALKGGTDAIQLQTDLPIIIDTRLDVMAYREDVENTLALYQDNTDDIVVSNVSIPQPGTYSRLIDLPYKGTINAAQGVAVEPDEVVAINQYEPARLFVINAINTNTKIQESLIRQSLQVAVGDEIDFDQVLARPIPSAGIRSAFHSPVRAKVEYIEYSVGIIVASEIQNYDTRPHEINLAHKLGIKPRHVTACLQHHVGDFVYEGETLARKISRSVLSVAKAPSTGELISFDRKTGIMILQYRTKPIEYKGLVHGRVIKVEDGKSAEIEFDATRLEAAIGWGPKGYGTMKYMDRMAMDNVSISDVLILGFVPDDTQFQALLKAAPLAIICASMDERLVPEYLGYEQGVINTGFENPGTSLILMQGFGNLPYSKQQKDYLLASAGKACFVDPHTRIRAGVVRASIYVM